MSLQTLGWSKEVSESDFIVICWTTCGLATAFVGAKTVIRLTKVGRLAMDDYWMYFAWAILVTHSALNTAQSKSTYHITGVGAGLIEPGPELFVQGNIYVRYEFAVIGLFWTVLWSVKASLLALYYDLFNGHPIFKKLWWIVAVFCFFSYVGCWIASIMVCHPVSTYFDFGQCNKPIDQEGSKISVSYSTAVDVLTDFMIMLLPLNLIIQIKITTKAKLGLIACFSLGMITVACAIARAIQISTSTANDVVRLAIWSIIEATISMIVGCLPTFKALFSRRVSTNRSHPSDYDRYGPKSPAFGSSSGKRNSRIPLQSLNYSIHVRPKNSDLTSSSQEDIIDGKHRSDTWSWGGSGSSPPKVNPEEIGIASSGPLEINVQSEVMIVSEKEGGQV